MRNTHPFRGIPAFALATLLLATTWTGTAWAGDEEDEPIVVRKPVRWASVCKGDNMADCLSLLGRGGYLGVELTDLTPELRAHFGVGADAGTMVSKVLEGSPAEGAGLAVGDIITHIDGAAMDSRHAISRHVRAKEEGETAEVEAWRDGRRNTFYVEVEGRKGAHHLNDFVIDMQDLGKAQVFPFAVEGTEEALAAAREALKGIDWSQHAQKLEAIDFSSLEERMEQLQERMKEIEQRLQEDYDGQD